MGSRHGSMSPPIPPPRSWTLGNWRPFAIPLELQRAFGLRRDEAIRILPAQADQGDRLVVHAAWTTGGRSREIPIRTAAQRDVLARAIQVAGHGALLPPRLSYRQQVRRYERHTAAAGLAKPHGLRHAYAQERYRELTGWAAPAAGGPPSTQLTLAQRVGDLEARLVISMELGHARERVTVAYLGR